MPNVINIVVACTKRKRARTIPDLQLRTVSGKTLIARYRAWRSRLGKNSDRFLYARDLYAGDHWTVVKSLPEVAARSGFAARVWVCSAGYGLIPLDARVHSYQATFTPGSPDSVSRGSQNGSASQAAKLWWELLSSWRGPVPNAPRSIHALARRHPRCPLLIVASPGYVNAIEDDLASAAKILRQPGDLIVFSSVPRTNSPLSSYFVPCSAVLQRVVGGARTSLNVRLLRRILQQCRSGRLRHTSVRQSLQNLIRRQPQEARVIRRSASDAQVRRYIARELKVNRKIKLGPLLQKFRCRGNACEYSRFRRLLWDAQKRGIRGA
jgi:hypothetical protein